MATLMADAGADVNSKSVSPFLPSPNMILKGHPSYSAIWINNIQKLN